MKPIEGYYLIKPEDFFWRPCNPEFLAAAKAKP
jgi:hypothetical protein